VPAINDDASFNSPNGAANIFSKGATANSLVVDQANVANVVFGGGLTANLLTIDSGGVLLVKGGGSSADAGGMVLGSLNNSTGEARVLNGGSVITWTSTLGETLGSFGKVVISGSAWHNSQTFVVGNKGSGQLEIRNGIFSTSDLVIGNNSAPLTSDVVLDGIGSKLSVTKDLVVGELGFGAQLNASGKSAIDVGGDLVIAHGLGSGGSFALDYDHSVPGSAGYVNAKVAGTVRVGSGGYGILTVGAGSVLTSVDGIVGGSALSRGEVSIFGADSTWSLGSLAVGDKGEASVRVYNGGKLKTNSVSIGLQSQSVGDVSLQGINSQFFAVSGFIGVNGWGSVTISDGSDFIVPNLEIAKNINSHGTLNVGAAPGNAPTGAGRAYVSTLYFGDGAGILNFNHLEKGYDFYSEISGHGAINVLAGNTTLSSDSPNFVGSVNVTGGRLSVNGALSKSSVFVSGTGVFGGTGVVGNVDIAGGTLAPGNSIGTLNVAGDIKFSSGSTYQLEVNTAGQSDRVAADGVATLAGNVKVLAGAGNYAPSTKYTILTAGGGRTGVFDSVASDMAFLDPSLSYDANAAYLTLTRNGVPFGGVGETANQGAVGGGIESTGIFGLTGVYGSVLTMNAAAARYAFDQLSGEAHASARSVLIEDSRFLREAAMDRLRPTGGSDTREGARNAQGLAVWSRAIGSWGKLDGGRNGDGNGFGYQPGTAKVSRDMGGLLVGADVDLGDTWRAGVVGGLSHTTFKANERSSSGNSDNYHLGIYGGASFGENKAWGVRTGLAYTRHRMETSRTVSFPGFADSLRSDSSASTTQAFGELGYKLQGEAGILEPFANLAHVNYSSGRFNERGGLAALTSLGGSTGVTYSTLGVRGSTKLDFGSGSNVTARGTLGWAHALGSTTPKSQMAFAGGTPFTISGVPLAKNVAVVEAGLDFAITPSSTLSVSYGGQFGSGVRDQGVKANLSVKF